MKNLLKSASILFLFTLVSCQEKENDWDLMKSNKDGVIQCSTFQYMTSLGDHSPLQVNSYFKLYRRDGNLMVELSVENMIPKQTLGVLMYNFIEKDDDSKLISLQCSDGTLLFLCKEDDKVEVWIPLDIDGTWILYNECVITEKVFGNMIETMLGVDNEE